MTETQNQKTNPWKSKIFLVVLIFGAGIFIGYKLKGNNSPINGTPENVAVREGGYKFTNPLLDCEQAEGLFSELKPVKSEVEKLIEQEKQNNNASFVSVYYRDLNNGPWLGINEKENFSPASLLKLPLMMAYYKMSETDANILEKSFTFNSAPNDPKLNQTILPKETLEEGKAYSVKDLIYRMIVYSDNRAFYLLADNADVTTMQKTFSEFGLQWPGKPEDDFLVNVKNYAAYYRVLFNSSFLSRQNSEQALQLLSESEFKDGLVAGVPQNFSVAHKFGERQNTGGTQKQLHDCGIVYYPNHPYLLCLMTRGDDNTKLAKTISEISKLVYEEVDRQNK